MPTLPKRSVDFWVAAPLVALIGLAAAAGAWWLSTRDPESEPVAIDAGAPVGEDGSAPDATVGLRPEWVTLVHFERGVESSAFSLGAPDGRCAIIQPRGVLTFVLPPGHPMETDRGEGAELRIVVDDARSGPYRLEVGIDHDSYGVVARAMVGSALVDVDPAEVVRFQAVRIQNREPQGAVCVDAIALLRE